MRSRINAVGVGAFTVMIVASLAVTGVIWAHGGDETKIHGCVSPSGLLRVVGASEPCNFGERAIDWNIQGPPGASGATTVQYVTVQAFTFARAFCPAGTKVTGGGAFVTGGAGPSWAIGQSFPIADATGVVASGNTAVGWQAASADGTGIVSVTAICVAP